MESFGYDPHHPRLPERVMLAEIEFPWSLYVSANQRLVPRGDRLVSSPEYRERMEAARLFARNAYSGDPVAYDVRVRETIVPPDRRKRDVRNCGKLFEDALEGVVYEDDGQIKELEMEMREPSEEPRVVVQVEVL